MHTTITQLEHNGQEFSLITPLTIRLVGTPQRSEDGGLIYDLECPEIRWTESIETDAFRDEVTEEQIRDTASRLLGATYTLYTDSGVKSRLSQLVERP